MKILGIRNTLASMRKQHALLAARESQERQEDDFRSAGVIALSLRLIVQRGADDGTDLRFQCARLTEVPTLPSEPIPRIKESSPCWSSDRMIMIRPSVQCTQIEELMM